MNARRKRAKLGHMSRPNTLGDGSRRYSIGFSAETDKRLWEESGRRRVSVSEIVRVLVRERLAQLDAEMDRREPNTE